MKRAPFQIAVMTGYWNCAPRPGMAQDYMASGLPYVDKPAPQKR